MPRKGDSSLKQWREVIQQPLYSTDFLAIGAVTTGDDLALTDKTLFSTNQGGNLNRTNMTQVGQLPAGQQFKVYAVRYEALFFPINGDGTPTGLANTQELAVANLMGTSMEVRVTESIALQAPAIMLPAGMGPFGFVNDSSHALITNGQPIQTAKYLLSQPHVMEKQAGIVAQLKRPPIGTFDLLAAINTYTGLKVSRLYLDGLKLRSATGK